jgi:hypothetical protein
MKSIDFGGFEMLRLFRPRRFQPRGLRVGIVESGGELWSASTTNISDVLRYTALPARLLPGSVAAPVTWGLTASNRVCILTPSGGIAGGIICFPSTKGVTPRSGRSRLRRSYQPGGSRAFLVSLNPSRQTHVPRSCLNRRGAGYNQAMRQSGDTALRSFFVSGGKQVWVPDSPTGLVNAD